MPDLGRKDAGDKLTEGVTPDSQKGVLEQGQEKATDAADTVAGSVQPSGEKSTGQKAMDSTTGSDDKGLMDKAKDTIGMGDK